MTARAVSIADIESRSFFAELAPDLAITASITAPTYAAPAEPTWRGAGHTALPNVVAKERIPVMAAAVEALVARGLPPIFAYVYDAFWEPAAALAAYAERVLGPCTLFSDGWAWHVPPGPEQRGWPPHRDWQDPDAKLITIWVALTDADEDSACMHVVPLDRDPAYSAGRLEDRSIPDGAAVPLVVEAGTALVWDAHILHWGGRSSDRARGPRVSFSYAFGAEDGADTGKLPLTLTRFDFKDRLDAIANMIVAYEHQVRMPPPIDGWATMLAGLRAILRRRPPR